jgi:hypothetical protein
MAIAVGAISGTAFVTGVGTAPNFTTLAYSSTGTVRWTNRYSGPAQWDEPRAIATDENESVYIVGYSDATNRQTDTAIVPYSAGGIALWTNRYGEPAAGYPVAYPEAIGTSPDRVYVAGDLTADGYGLCRPFVIAYTAKGDALWTNHYNATPSYTDSVQAMAVGHDGSVFVTGGCNALGNAPDWFTIAYSPDGAGIWTNRYNGPAGGSDFAMAIALHGGQVYVAGYSAGLGTGWDLTVIAYSADGQGLWTNRYDGPAHGDDLPQDMAVDAQGNVFLSGTSGALKTMVAYSAAGVPLWTNNGLPGVVSALASIGTGGVVGAGYTTSLDPRGAYLAMGFSPSRVLWTNTFHGDSDLDDYASGPFCLAVGPGGSIYVTGYSEMPHPGGTNRDFVTVKYVPIPAIRFSAAKPQSNATFRLTITAPTNTPYRLEASPDLANWQTLTNFAPLPVESVNYTDTQAPGFARRYYRTVWNP